METPDARLKERLNIARARLLKLEARFATQARKNDTRRKIIAGALLFDAAEKDERHAALLRELLARIDRPNDRRPFIGWVIPSPSVLESGELS